jgi:hypothetical protein
MLRPPLLTATGRDDEAAATLTASRQAKLQARWGHHGELQCELVQRNAERG